MACTFVCLDVINKEIIMIKKAFVATIISVAISVPFLYAAPADNQKLVLTTLANMESPAEDILDAIDAKDMKKMQSLFHDMDASMNKLKHIKEANLESSKSIAMLNAWFDLISLEMVEADDMPALANAVNQFSGQLIIATPFAYDFQKNVAWMDYLGREILLLNKYPSSSTFHDALVQVRKNELSATWSSIKVEALKHKGGKALIANVEPNIVAIEKENNGKSLVKLAEAELELVDNIESFFPSLI